MAIQPPDPRTLGSWEDAFQYPLPVVRKLEQQLRKNIDENRQKLRSLVGSSYRDLLGTAERIIDMDEQVQKVEGNLGDIGRKCNARRLEKVAANHEKMKRERGAGEQARYRSMAQTKALQNAITVAVREVKKGGDALLASKLLVLGRLLHKSLSETAEPPTVLEEFRRRLGQARKRLLSYIGRILVKSSDRMTTLADTLTAYSLITSSSPKDVLQYFLSVRFEQMELEAETPTSQNIIQMLNLYNRTLLDSKALFPRRFADSLFQLGKSALLQDSQLRSVIELSLDIYEQWIAEDVRHFTPWVRHEQLTPTEVGDAMVSWTKEARACLLQGLTEALDGQSDAHEVLIMRQTVLAKYLSLTAQLRDEGQMDAINDVRERFLIRMEVLADKASDVSQIKLDGQDESPSTSMSDLWALATDTSDLHGGAIHLRQAVIQLHNGRNAAVTNVSKSLDDWIERLDRFDAVIAAMRAAKWDEHIDLDLDDDLTDPDRIQALLSKQDPQRLDTRLQKVTTDAVRQLYLQIEQASSSSSTPVPHPTYLLRTLREIDHRRRILASRTPVLANLRHNTSFTTTLHRQIAVSVFDASASHLQVRELPAPHTSLWDAGTPPLPLQPSPLTFRFLTALHRRMTEIGNDVWSPDAVHALKICAGEKAAAELRSALEAGDSAVNGQVGEEEQPKGEKDGAKENGHVNGEVDTSHDPKSQARERSLQRLFDTQYLQHVFATGKLEKGEGPGKGDGIDTLVDTLEERVGEELDSASKARLRKNAGEYWKRTYLLFGLLAPGRG